jgi:para-nitrobenzyl esterase
MQFLTGSPRLAQNEDNSLTLNVWTPDLAGRRPVLVWIHGSGWMTGSSRWPRHNGSKLAAGGDIVVVTANNRLGPLGVLHLAGISNGKMGLPDSIAVPRWVNENTAAFDGDSDLVTVAGQSGGVTAVALWLRLWPRTFSAGLRAKRSHRTSSENATACDGNGRGISGRTWLAA